MEGVIDPSSDYVSGQLDWKRVRPRGDWALVKTDPRVKQTKGGLHLPDGLLGMEKMSEATGVVLRLGGTVCDTLNFGLEPGMRVCFRGFLKDASAHIFERHEDGCEVFMITADDILAVVDESVQVGALS